MGKRCNKKVAVLLLASYGVDIDVIAKALCLKPSTVRQYIKRYGRRVGSNNVEGRRTGGPKTTQSIEQPVLTTVQTPLSNNP